MDLKGKVASITYYKTAVDIIDATTGQVVQKHDAEGTVCNSAAVQKNIAAVAVFKPQHAVHVMDLVSGKVFYKFIPPIGEDARVALSKDALALAVGTSTGVI